jgi:hypothetical protein
MELDVFDHVVDIHALARALAYLLLVHLLCAHCLLTKPFAQIARLPPDDTADHNARPKHHCEYHKRNGEPHDEQPSAYYYGEHLRQ